LSQQNELTVVHSNRSFEFLKQETKKSWITLPSSVNGTLIYFLLVENNREEFVLWDFIQCLLFVGFPVFFTFYLQALLLFAIWLNVPSFSTDDNICGTNAMVQWAVVGIFMIFLIPSVKSIVKETLCILRTGRIAFQREEDADQTVVCKLVNSEAKKSLTFFLIVAPEFTILFFLWYVGSGFM
jgi:hypothetical protein